MPYFLRSEDYWNVYWKSSCTDMRYSSYTSLPSSKFENVDGNVWKYHGESNCSWFIKENDMLIIHREDGPAIISNINTNDIYPRERYFLWGTEIVREQLYEHIRKKSAGQDLHCFTQL